MELFANSGDPAQMLHLAESDLGLHCMPVTLLRVSRLQWGKLPLNHALASEIQQFLCDF